MFFLWRFSFEVTVFLSIVISKVDTVTIIWNPANESNKQRYILVLSGSLLEHNADINKINNDLTNGNRGYQKPW